MDRGAWQATVHGAGNSRTWLKWINTHKGHKASVFVHSECNFIICYTTYNRVPFISCPYVIHFVFNWNMFTANVVFSKLKLMSWARIQAPEANCLGLNLGCATYYLCNLWQIKRGCDGMGWEGGLRGRGDICVCVCVCIHMYIYVCVCIYIYIYIYIVLLGQTCLLLQVSLDFLLLNSSLVQLFATPWTVARQTPLSMGTNTKKRCPFHHRGLKCILYLEYKMNQGKG